MDRINTQKFNLSINKSDSSKTDDVLGALFSIPLTVDEKKVNGIQIEEFEGKIDSSSVRWVNDCEMILSPINPKSLNEKKNILIKILTTTDSSYTYEYSYLGNSKKLKAEAIRIK